MWHHFLVTSLRPSFAERDSFRSALSQAYADGRIDDAEFERRSTLVESGDSADELREALADLPQPETEFPTTVTRAEALDRQRRGRTSTKVSRRSLFFIGAGILGAIGGFSDGLGGDSEEPAAESTQSQTTDYPTDATAIEGVVAAVKKKGYRDFQLMSFSSGDFTASARSPKNRNGLDSIQSYAGDEIEVQPSAHLGRNDTLFTLEGIDFDLIPTMCRGALDKLGGKTVTRAEITTSGDGEPTISVYVEGDDYGVGSGSLEWTKDGSQLLRIARQDED